MMFRWVDWSFCCLSFPINCFTAAPLICWAHVLPGFIRGCSWERLFAASQCSALAKLGDVGCRSMLGDWWSTSRCNIISSYVVFIFARRFAEAKNEYLCGPHWLWIFPWVVHSRNRTCSKIPRHLGFRQLSDLSSKKSPQDICPVLSIKWVFPKIMVPPNHPF